MTSAKTLGTCAHCQQVRKIKARRLCGTCYNRANKIKLRTGVETAPDKVRLTGTEHLERMTDMDPEACWPWPGPLSDHGYGLFLETGTRDYAHRVVYENTYGPIPEALTIDHTCRNRACVNPGHLETVTRGETLHRAVAHMPPHPGKV